MGSLASKIYEFGPFRLDAADRRLTRNGQPVALPPKVFDTLTALLEADGRLVEKDALMKSVWADAFVEEVNLARNVSLLRKELGERTPGQPYIETVPTRGYRFSAPIVHSGPDQVDRTPTAQRIDEARRIAAVVVMPFTNLSAHPEQEYFVDGMTDTVIGAVAAISGLRVISRTSSMRFKDSRASLAEVARTLRVDACLEGSTVRSGDRIRINVRLVDALTDSVLWSAGYDRTLEDILIVQSEIAHEIAASLRLALTASHTDGRISRVDPNAYELYLRGRFHCSMFTAAGIQRGLEYFAQALALDEHCALTYSGQCHAWFLLGLDLVRPERAFPNVRNAARKAIDIDPRLSDAHVYLGFVHGYYDWNWSAAEECARHAAALNPSSHIAKLLHCNVRIAHGDLAGALGHIREAKVLDPLNPFVNSLLALLLVTAVRHEEAEDTLANLIEIAPQYALAHQVRALLLEEQGRYRDALGELQHALEMFGPSTLLKGALGRLHALIGEQDRARQLLHEVEMVPSEGESGCDPVAAALVEVGLGRVDEAFVRLEEACRYRSTQLVWLGLSSVWAPLRSDPRFHVLLARLRAGREPSHDAAAQ